VAELEAGMISARTKAALAAAKVRRENEGKPGLGGFRGHVATDAAREAAKASNAARVASRVADIAPTITELRAAGIVSARGIAKALTERGIPTARGSTAWSVTQVQRVLSRLPD
jgi:DNA invertase Pin-like site-specific DNA recombinase